jgi:hypothetical protein
MEFRPAPLLLALTLASVLAATPMLALVVNGDLHLSGSVESAAACIFGTSWVLWLAGTGVSVSVAFWRGKLRGGALRILGTVLALLHPMVVFAISVSVLPSLAPAAFPPNAGGEQLTDTFGVSLGAGILQIAFGWFGGWIVWRLGFPSLATQLTADDIAASRGWHAIKRFRFAFAFLLLPLLLASAVVASFLLPGSEEPGFVVVAVAAFPIAALIALVFFGALRAFQAVVTRGNCCFLGAIVGLALPATTDPFFSETISDSVAERFALLFCIGSVLLPLGLLGGWLVWRIGIAPEPQPVPAGAGTAARASSRYRHWQDLHVGRLSFGLSLAPLVMTALLVLIWIVDASMTTEETIHATIGILIIGIAWCLIGGWAYLLAVTRRRRKISRIECLLFGLVLAELVPLLLISLVFAIEGWASVIDMFGSPEADAFYIAAIILAVEIIFAPMGLLNGWLFWRFGVRPAPLPEPDVSAVFD